MRISSNFNPSSNGGSNPGPITDFSKLRPPPKLNTLQQRVILVKTSEDDIIILPNADGAVANRRGNTTHGWENSNEPRPLSVPPTTGSMYESSGSDQNNDKARQEAYKAWKAALRTVMKILFSHIGSFFMVIGYMVLGGFLFNYLETENELIACRQYAFNYAKTLDNSIRRIAAFSQMTSSTFDIHNFTTALRTALHNHSVEVFKLGFDPRKNCSLLGQPNHQYQWSVPMAVYFSATVMTTIGYGFIAPNTPWGRIVCIVYAVLGIPIMLLFLTNVGEVMAQAFRYVYVNLCCCRCFLRHQARHLLRQQSEQRHSKSMKRESVFSENGGSLKWSEDGISRDPPNIELVPYPQLPTETKSPPENSKETSLGDAESGLYPSGVVIHELSEDDATALQLMEEELEHVDVTIPISVTLAVLLVYIVVGAYLFRIWEDWSLTDGIYFAFVTLSTIGFGDLVPAKEGFEKEAAVMEMILGAMYCLCGLAILSMCLNLIQDELTAKFHWLGQKLGVVDEQDQDAEGGSSPAFIVQEKPSPEPSNANGTASMSLSGNMRHHQSVPYLPQTVSIKVAE